MDFSSVDAIKEAGYRGFRSVSELWADDSAIPATRGVYMVLTLDEGEPEFTNPGVGGVFKGKDPNVSKDELRSRVVPGSIVVYIGKAGAPDSDSTLRSRLKQLLRFGQGKNVGHWGGRLLWQIKRHAHLVVCWKVTPNDDPRQVEKELIRDFQGQFSRKPFANLNA